jgi:hypothetical protein
VVCAKRFKGSGSPNESIHSGDFTLDDLKLVMEIDKKNFSVMLYENWLKVEPKKSFVHELEEALEHKPILKDTVGEILHIFAPLHIRLSQIEKVDVHEKGSVRLAIPHHRDVTIPLKPEESKKLVDKLNELIPKEKEKELERILTERRLQKDAGMEEGVERAPFISGSFQVPPTEGMLEAERKAEEHIEEKEREEEPDSR